MPNQAGRFSGIVRTTPIGAPFCRKPDKPRRPVRDKRQLCQQMDLGCCAMLCRKKRNIQRCMNSQRDMAQPLASHAPGWASFPSTSCRCYSIACILKHFCVLVYISPPWCQNHFQFRARSHPVVQRAAGGTSSGAGWRLCISCI